jgi:hypothetical protein
VILEKEIIPIQASNRVNSNSFDVQLWDLISIFEDSDSRHTQTTDSCFFSTENLLDTHFSFSSTVTANTFELLKNPELDQSCQKNSSTTANVSSLTNEIDNFSTRPKVSFAGWYDTD